MFGREKAPMPEQENEIKYNEIWKEIEAIYPTKCAVISRESGLRLYVEAYGFEHGLVFFKARQEDMEMNPDAMKELLALKQHDQKVVFPNAKNTMTGEDLSDKVKNYYRNWSTDHPYLVALDARELLKQEATKVERAADQSDLINYYRATFSDPETNEVWRLEDVDPKSNVYEVRNSMGYSGKITPKELFGNYKISAEGLRVPFPGDDWGEKKSMSSRMAEPKIVKINYTDIRNKIVYFTRSGEKVQTKMPLDQFVQEFMEIIEER